MKTVIVAILSFAVGGILVSYILKRHEPAQKPNEAEHAEDSHVQRGTNGEALLKFDKETQRRMGLQLSTLVPAEMQPEVRGYGRVLDPGSLATLATEIDMARTALDAATKDFQRVKTLYSQNQNASARSLETAETSVKRDALLLERAQLQLLSTWGKAVADQTNLAAFARSLSVQETALVQINLPLGEALSSPPTKARLAALGVEETPLAAQFLGPAPNTDPQTQGQGFQFLVKAASLRPGAAVAGWLAIAGPPQTGTVLPSAALIRHESEVFVYVQDGPETFRRKAVELEWPEENGWFVRGGVRSGESVVTVGAQQMLSEELKSKGGEE